LAGFLKRYNASYSYFSRVWLVWCSGNGFGHINKVKLRRARLVLGLVTTFGGATIPLHSRPLSLAVPRWVDAVLAIFSQLSSVDSRPSSSHEASLTDATA